MIHPIIQEIIKKKKPCYFISPHFDDAILSAGALLQYLSKKTSVTVVNVFTKAEKGASTLSAKQFLRQCGYQNAVTLFTDRKKEDAAVLEKVSDMVVNLGHTDALWRKKYQKDIISSLLFFLPEAKALYPTYRFHISKGRIASQDKVLIEKIKEELQKIIVEKDAVIFCPVGIGNHVDHLITRKACEGLQKSLIYWSDFPYNQTLSFRGEKRREIPRGSLTSFEMTKLIEFSFTENLERKRELVKGYKTQYKVLFPQEFPRVPEVFYETNYYLS